MSYWFLSDSTD